VTTLGIDLGTGSVKAAIVEPDGTVTNRTSQPYRVRSPHPGWAESDPREWLAATRAVAASTLAGLPERPTAVGICGQMHGIVVVDERLAPLRPAIIWADARSREQAADLARALAPEDLARLGSAAVPGFAATSLAWLLAHEPQVMAKARHVLQPKDWLRAMLGGALATDPSDASGTLLFDVVSGAWSTAALDWLGIDPALLPAVLASTDEAGEVRLGDRDLPCIVGGADTACALAGIGAVPGFLAVGTGAQAVRRLDAPDLDPTLRTHTLASVGAAAGPGRGWYRLGAVQNAGLAMVTALDWLDSTPDEAAEALEVGVQPDDPLFLPYLAGERGGAAGGPGLRGSWHGLTLGTTRPALLRSVLEGVAQAVALAVESVQDAGAETGHALPDPLPLVGGGTHDARFRHLLADACGIALARVDAPDAAVAGAGLLAAGLAQRPAPAPATEVVDPVGLQQRLLAERRQRFADLVRLLDN
jgi:xylulokinase